MKQLSNKLTNSLILLLCGLSLGACGTSNNPSGSTDSSSRALENSTKPLAYCNQATNTSFDVHLKAYTESSEAVRPDLVYVKADSLPSDFGKDESYLSFFRWKANSTNSPSLDSKALKFAILNASTKEYLTDWRTSIRWSDISAISVSLGVYYPNQFFNKVIVLVDLKDTTGEYDALKITQYGLGTNKSISSIDALIPIFHADPADYAIESDGSQRAYALQKIHPFADLKGQRSSSEFLKMSEAFCF
jgi:hypothetical protein